MISISSPIQLPPPPTRFLASPQSGISGSGVRPLQSRSQPPLLAPKAPLVGDDVTLEGSMLPDNIATDVFWAPPSSPPSNQIGVLPSRPSAPTPFLLARLAFILPPSSPRPQLKSYPSSRFFPSSQRLAWLSTVHPFPGLPFVLFFPILSFRIHVG